MRRNQRGGILGRKGGERRRPFRTCFSLEALERRELLSADVSAVGEGQGIPIRANYEPTGVRNRYSVSYEVTITNHGDGGEPVVLTDLVDPRLQSLRAGVLDYSGAYETSMDEAAGVVTITFPALTGTARAFVHGYASLAPAEYPAPPLTNQFSIATADPNTNPQTSGSMPVDAPDPIADASLTYQVDGSPIHMGGDVDYSFVVTNNSTIAPVPNARIVVNLPSDWQRDKTGFSADLNPGWEAVWDSSTWLDPYTWEAHTDTWLSGFTHQVGDLAPGESKTVPLKLRPELPGGRSPMLTFPAVVVTDAFETDASNNTVNIATPFVPETGIKINATPSSPFPTLIGDDLTYELLLGDAGPNPATGVVVHQKLPAGAAFVSASFNGNPIAGVVDDGTLVIALPDGPSRRLLITLNTAGMAAPTTATPVSASVAATWNESPAGDQAVVDLGSLTPRGYIGSLLQVVPNMPMSVNRMMTFWYTLSNPDTVASSSLTAVLTFPPQSVVAVPSAYSVERTPTSQIVTLHVPGLAAGETRRISISTVAPAPATAEIKVVANLTQDDQPERVYPTLSVTTSSFPVVSLALTRSADRRSVTVTNNGPSRATGVSVWWFTQPPPYQGYPPRTEKMSAPVGTLEVGQTVTVEIGNIDFVFGPSANPVYVSSNEQAYSGEPADTAAYTLITSLNTDVASVEAGDLALFGAATMNMGPWDVENLQLIATIPANSRLVSTAPGVAVVGNRLTLDIATLAVGQEVGFWYVVSPTWDAIAAGGLTSEASVVTTRKLNEYYGRSKTSTTISVTAGSPGTPAPGPGHDHATPAVADVQWVGPPRGMAAIQVTLAQPLAGATALDPSTFTLVAAGRGPLFGARMGRPIPVRSAYIPETSTIVLTPRRPLPANMFYQLTVAGGGPTPGSNYVASLARGQNLSYAAPAGDLVTLRLRGAGYIDALLTGPNLEERLNVVSLGPRQASVVRKVVKLHPRGAGPVRLQPPSRPPLAWNRLAASSMRRPF